MDIPGLSAADSALTIKTDEGQFLVLSMTGHEHLGQMFEYTVDLAEVPSAGLNPLADPKGADLSKLIGTVATLTLKVDDDARYFQGHVTRAKRCEKRGRYLTYTITLEPWIWFMTRTKNSRVFQDKSVKDVVTEVLQDYSTDSDWRLLVESAYPKLDYCVQYNETDFDFVGRLLEEVGIYYFFEHTDSSHTMVLIDDTALHKPRKGTAAINWSNAMQTTSTITTWYVQQEVRSATAALSEYDYLAPTTKIEGSKDAKKQPEMLGKMEWFEHPARVVQNSAKPDVQTTSATAITQRAQVRIEELGTLYSSATGLTNVRDLGIGMTFEIAGVPKPNDDDDGHYLMVSAVYRMDFGDYEAVKDLSTGRRHEGYRCDFLSISKDLPYRTPRITPKPVIAGPQTAIVVGASGNEIETDKHGRIKVHFFWDRKGPTDQTSSCWVRVVQPWAGKGYGMFTLPRVGHEVVVQFLDGDPDRPLVTGSVYNNDNMVAWKMPDNATVGGIKTQSSKGGSADTANELRFEDKKDSEYVWFQAQKDFHRLVENDAFDFIGNNESVKVVLTRKEVIGENWYMDVTKDVMHNLGKDLHVNVAGDIFYTGAATYQMKVAKDVSAKAGGDLGIDVGGKTQLKSQDDIVLQSSTGKLSLKAGSSGDVLVEGMSIKIKGSATIAIEATGGVSLKCGGSFVNVGPAGVDIVGTLVKINSGGSGGSASAALAASPTAPTDAKKEDSITAAKKDDYDKTFDDPMPKASS